MNKLYYADCLDVLKDLHRHLPDGFIDWYILTRFSIQKEIITYYLINIF